MKVNKTFIKKYCLISFFITALILLLIFSLYEVYPFGNRIVLSSDLASQYAPFFTELYDRIINVRSLIYSFNNGLGLPFLGNLFNYLCTPLFFLIFIFGREELPTAIALMILLKSSFSAASFTYYLKNSQEKYSVITSGFGILYALSGWFVAYYFDIMWLDAVVFLPLVILGIEKIINIDKPYMYIGFLSLTLITNYYMGYMVCIFSVIYYFVYYFSNYTIKSKSEGKIKNLFVDRSVSFGVSSLCCGALSAFVLVPVFVILQGSSATSESWPALPELHFNFWNFFANHFMDAVPTFDNGTGSIPNVYCGILTLILLPVYFISKNTRAKEKVIYGFLLAFLYFSFNFNYFDFIWHAFHFPNGMPYRFSYIYCFVLLIMAYKALCNFDSIKISTIAISFALIIVLSVISFYLGENIEKQSFVFSLIFAALYLILLILFRKPKSKEVISFFIFITIVIEILFADGGNFEIYKHKNNYLTDYDEIVELNNKARDNDNELFYRTESLSASVSNGGSAYNYFGISSFSSMGYEKVARLQDALGAECNTINNFRYSKQTPIYDMMHALKYVSYYGKLTNFDDIYYSKTRLKSGKNQYYLPLAFCVSKNVVEWNIENKNPFEVQNDWFKLASKSDDVLVPLKQINMVSDGLEYVGYDGETGEIKYKKEPGAKKSTVEVSFAGNGSKCYIFSESKDKYIMDAVKEIKDNENEKIINVEEEIGEKFDDEGTAYVCAYTVNEEALNKGYEKLKSQVMTIDTFDETYIKGGVTAKEDCVLYTSIPFDKGWTVSIDGKEINEDDYIALGNAYLCFNISQGDHTVEFSFRQRGLKEGISISVITLVSLIAYAVIKKKK